MKKVQEIRAEIDPALHRAVKTEASREGKSIRQAVVEALRLWLKEKDIEVE